MTSQIRRRRATTLPTIIRIYRPDPERQLQALRFLLEAKGRKAPARPSQEEERRTSEQAAHPLVTDIAPEAGDTEECET